MEEGAVCGNRCFNILGIQPSNLYELGMSFLSHYSGNSTTETTPRDQRPCNLPRLYAIESFVQQPSAVTVHHLPRLGPDSWKNAFTRALRRVPPGLQPTCPVFARWRAGGWSAWRARVVLLGKAVCLGKGGRGNSRSCAGRRLLCVGRSNLRSRLRPPTPGTVHGDSGGAFVLLIPPWPAPDPQLAAHMLEG
jgi:hypothetical protein